MYTKEILALKKSDRYRERNLFDPSLIDLASNDYLGLAHHTPLLEKTYQQLKEHAYHSPKASMLVNGYSTIHHSFEEELASLNQFEQGLIVGNGFVANIALIESLVRKGDTLFIDEDYHASGILSTQLLSNNRVVVFKHNNSDDLRNKIKQTKKKPSHRFIIAIEGIYSMKGTLANRAIFDIADEYETLLIVDEAHSSGTLGKNLLGIFDYYEIPIKSHYIKMGTLGKAYGSYGAYILASHTIIDYLINRAKPIVYSTAPSLFDTLLAHNALHHICDNAPLLNQKIQERLDTIHPWLGHKHHSLIIPIVIGDNQRVITIKRSLQTQGYSVGAIRQPTVKQAIIRLIARITVPLQQLKQSYHSIQELM